MKLKKVSYCPFCGRDIKTKEYAKNHVRCPECGVSFTITRTNGSRFEVNILGDSSGVKEIVSATPSILDDHLS